MHSILRVQSSQLICFLDAVFIPRELVVYVSLGISPLVTSRSCDEQSTGGGTPGWGVRTKDGWEQDEDISSSVGRSSACLSRRLRHSAPIFATT